MDFERDPTTLEKEAEEESEKSWRRSGFAKDLVFCRVCVRKEARYQKAGTERTEETGCTMERAGA